jgi:hypothetical protein
MRSTRVLCLLFFLTSSAAFAQRIVNHQSVYWIRYQNQLIFSPAVYWNNEVDNRRFFHPDVQNQFIVHSRLHYKKDRWDFGGGLTGSWVFAQKPENASNNVVTEIRPVIEANYELPLGKFFLQNRVRVDSRFLEEDTERNVLKESLFVWRFRYRLQIRIPLLKNEENIPRATLRIAEEIMFNHIRNTFDQHRIYGTADFYVTKNISVEAGYIYIYQQRFGVNEYFERNVLRFSLLHKVMLH